jgi:mycobactin peptide synthetase MbtE
MMLQTIFQTALLNALEKNESRLAIQEAAQLLNYSELKSLSEAVAQRLLHHPGYEPGSSVGIVAGNTIELVSAVIGVSMAGGVFVPLDASLPGSRMILMLEIAAARILLCSGNMLIQQNIKEVSAGKISVLDLNDAVPGGNNVPLPVWKGEDALYIYFTSGSTGMPKAVLGCNQSLTHFINWEIAEMHIQPGSRFSQLINCGFDAFLRDVFVPLFSGGTIVAPVSRTSLLTEENLLNWVKQEQINYIHCVPSVFRLLNRAITSSADAASLKAIFMSGEKIHPAEVKSWFEKAGEQAALYNFYGATETTMIRSFHRIVPGDTLAATIPAGKPVADTRLYVLDNEFKHCAAGSEGDVYISSPFVTKGYFNAGKIEDGIFSSDLFGAGAAYRMYKTGDRGIINSNGDLDLRGRADAQFKINGIRIEPGEVESAIVDCEGVNEAAVFKTEAGGLEMLAAAIVMKDTNGQDAGRLTELLCSKMPAYMVPAKWIFLSKLPRLENGKLNRLGLSGMEETAADTAETLNETEQEIYSIWSSVINKTAFGKQRSFFELGGNSFHLINLVAKVFQQFSIRLSIKDIFRYNSVEKLAAFISQKNELVADAIPAVPDAAYYDLSRNQFQIFHQQQIFEGTALYNLPQFFTLEGAVEPEGLKSVFQKLLQAHPSLRTGYAFENNTPVQFIMKEAVVDFTYADMPGLSSADAERQMDSFIQPFNLEKPPLFRAKLIRTGDEKYLLMTDVHHIAADGFSQVILNRDMMLLSTGTALPAQTVRYIDYAAWQKNRQAETAVKAQQDYWVKKLTPLPRKVQLPVKTGITDENDLSSGTFFFAIDTYDTQRIKILAKEAEATVNTFLLAVFNILLARLSSQDDIIIGIPSDGRSRAELANIVGMFVNTLAIRNEVRQDLPFSRLLETVKTGMLEALDNQDVPFDELVNLLKVPHSTRNRLFNILFVYLNMEVQPASQGAITVHPYPRKTNSGRFDITLTGFEQAGEVKMKIEYLEKLFSSEQVSLIADYFKAIVKQVLDNREVTPGNIILHHSMESVDYEISDYEFNF